METLYDAYMDAFCYKKWMWQYYNDLSVNPIETPSLAISFIQEYFEEGVKENVFDLRWEKDFGNPYVRASHTVSTFFLGVLLQLKQDSSFCIEEGRYPFAYMWFICCLYHDIGYVFENNRLTVSRAELEQVHEQHQNIHINERVKYYEVLGLHDVAKMKRVCPNLPFGPNLCFAEGGFDNCNKSCKGYIRFNNGVEIRSSHYKNKLKNDYFRYKLFNFKNEDAVGIVIDHGIAGGDLLFNRLVDNYRLAYKKMANKKNSDSHKFCDFIYKRKHFACEQFKLFAYIADCISSHNIFKSSLENEELYEAYGLYELMSDKYEKISYYKNPLLFILCLADSLEPTKRFDLSYWETVLKGISIIFTADLKMVNVHIDYELIQRFPDETKKYVEGVNGISEFIDVEVNVEIINRHI